MQLIMVRHAIAQDREEFAKQTHLEDSFRPLTMKGRKKMHKMSLQLKDWIKDVDMIVSSPFARARQTADIIAGNFVKQKVVEATELVPHSPPLMFMKWLKSQGHHHRKIIAVGHEPQMSAFASYLMTGSTESVFMLKKSGMACFEIESWSEMGPSSAQMLWLLQPKQLVD